MSSMNVPEDAVAVEKSVRFSSTFEVHRSTHPSDMEDDELWYSAEDKARFDRSMVHDVMHLSNILAEAVANQDRRTLGDLMICCVGLERLLSRNPPQRYRSIRSTRARHVQEVLDAYHRLKDISEVIEEDLSHTSQVSSRPSRDQARRIAVAAAKFQTV